MNDELILKEAGPTLDAKYPGTGTEPVSRVEAKTIALDGALAVYKAAQGRR